jgi:hypothetical protein
MTQNDKNTLHKIKNTKKKKKKKKGTPMTAGINSQQNFNFW